MCQLAILTVLHKQGSYDELLIHFRHMRTLIIITDLSLSQHCATLKAHLVSLHWERLMSMTERIYMIDQMLSERQSVSVPQFLERLEVSLATFKRDLSQMKDRLHAPIIFDYELGGYRYDKNNTAHDLPFQLPGLWFSSSEIHALLTMHHMLSNLDTVGLLGGHIKPLLSRLTSLLGVADNAIEEVQRRVKIEMIGVREVKLAHFESIGSALLRRKRVQVEYYSRSKNEVTQRELSPQRLIYYQGNWYMDAWCHLRNELRSFSVDAIQSLVTLEKKTKDVADKTLDEVLGAGYGIFSGKKVQWATLLFSPEVARWVSAERWHPNQKSKYNADGTYELKVPYSNHTELMMDILRHGCSVKVTAPADLVKRISIEVENMKKVYS
jgi:predicted DNA-binding transcriptional regulator YafY